MRYFTCAAAAACLASPALSQNQPAAQLPSPQDVSNRDTLTIGLGGAVLPDYEGSDDYRIMPAGAVRGQYHGISFITRGTYLYVDVIPRSGKVDVDAGPIVGVRFNNSRRGIDDPVVRLLPKRKRAFEVGGFAGVSFHGITNPYDSLAFRVDVLHDVSGAHQSTTFSPNVEFSTPLSRWTYASATVGAEYVSNKFADYYFSISPADRLATGNQLPLFNADGGMKNWKAGLMLDQSLTGDLMGGLSVFGMGQFSRLVGDFKRSPLVSERGSASQWLGALGLAYTW